MIKRFALALVAVVWAATAHACLTTTYAGSCGNSGPHPITTPAFVPQPGSLMSVSAPVGQINAVLRPNNNVAGSLFSPTGLVTGSLAITLDMQVNPNLGSGATPTETVANSSTGSSNGLTISGDTQGSPSFFINRFAGGWWNAYSLNLLAGNPGTSGGGTYASGVFPYSISTGGCLKQPSGVWASPGAASVGGAPVFTNFITNPGFQCGVTPTTLVAADIANIPGTGAKQTTIGTTCSGAGIISTSVTTAHGVTPGMGSITLSGYSGGTSPLWSTINQTNYVALPGTSGSSLVLTSPSVTTCPAGTAVVEGSAFTGVSGTLSFPALSVVTGGTGITTKNGEHACLLVVENGSNSSFPGSQAFSALHTDGAPLPNAPALVTWLNQGTAVWSAALSSTTNPTIAVITPTPISFSAWAYNGTTGYVAFTTAATNLTPGSEFTVTTGGGGTNGITYVAVDPTGIGAPAYQSSTTVWGNPLSGPYGTPLANTPSPGSTSGSFTSVPMPGMTVQGATPAANISPIDPTLTAPNYRITAAQTATAISTFGFEPEYYTASGSTITLKTQAVVNDFWTFIGSRVATNSANAAGFGGSIANLGMLWGNFPMATAASDPTEQINAPSTSAFAPLCKKTTDYVTFAAAQTAAGNPMSVHSLVRMNDPGIWADSGAWNGTGYLTGSGTTGVLNISSTKNGLLTGTTAVPAGSIVVLAGPGIPGCPSACPTFPLGSGPTYTLTWGSSIGGNAGSIGSPIALTAGTYRPMLPLNLNTVNGYIDNGSGSTPTLHVTSLPTASPNASFTATLGSTFTARIDIGATAGSAAGHTLTVTLPADPSLQGGYAPLGVGTTVMTPSGNMTVLSGWPQINPDTGLQLTGYGWAGTYSLVASDPAQNLSSQVLFATGQLPAAANQLLLQSAVTGGGIASGMLVTDGNNHITGQQPILITSSGAVTAPGIGTGTGATWSISPTYYSFSNDALIGSTARLTPGQYIQTTAAPTSAAPGITSPVSIIGYAPGFNASVFPQNYLLSNGASNGVGNPVGTGAGPVTINGTGIGDAGAVASGTALTLKDLGPGVTFPINYPATCTSVGVCNAAATIKVSGTFDTAAVASGGLGGAPSTLQGAISYTPFGPPIPGCSACAWTNLSGYSATLSSGTVWNWSGNLVNIPATGAPLFVSVCAANGIPACNTSNATAYAAIQSPVRIGVPVTTSGEGEVDAWGGAQSGGAVSTLSALFETNIAAGIINAEAALAGPTVTGTTFSPSYTQMFAADSIAIDGYASAMALSEGETNYDQGLSSAFGGWSVTLNSGTRDGIGSAEKTLDNTGQAQTVGLGNGSLTTWCSAAKFCSNVSGAGPLFATFGQQTGATIVGGTITSGTPATLTIPAGNVTGGAPNSNGFVFGGLQPGMVLQVGSGITLSGCTTNCTIANYPGIYTAGLQQIWNIAGCTSSCPSAPATMRIEPATGPAPWPTYNYQQLVPAGFNNGFGNTRTTQMIKYGTFSVAVNGTVVCTDTATFAYNPQGGTCSGAGITSSFVNYVTGDYSLTFAAAPTGPIVASWTNIMSVSGSASPSFDRIQPVGVVGTGGNTGWLSSVLAKTPAGEAINIDGGDIADDQALSQMGYPLGAVGLTQTRSDYYGTRLPATIPGQNANTPVASVQAWRAAGVNTYNIAAGAAATVGQLFAQWGIDLATKSTFSGSIGSGILTLSSAATGPMWEGEVIDCVTVGGACTAGPSAGMYITGICTAANCSAASPSGWGTNGSTYALGGASGVTSTGVLQNAVYYQGPGPAFFSGPINDVAVQNGAGLEPGQAAHMTNSPFTGGRVGRRFAALHWGAYTGDPTYSSNPTISRASGSTACPTSASPCLDVSNTYAATGTGTVAAGTGIFTGQSVITFTGGLAAHARPFVVGQWVTCASCTPQAIQSVSLPPSQDATRTNAGQVGNTFTVTLAGSLGVTGSKAITAGCTGTGGSNCINLVFQAGTTKGTFGTPFALATCGENNLNGTAPNAAGPSGICHSNGIGSLVRNFRIGTAQSMFAGIQTGTTGGGFILGSGYDDGIFIAPGSFDQSSAFTCNIVDTVVVQCVKGIPYDPTTHLLVGTVGKWSSNATYAEYGDTFLGTGRNGGLLGYVGGQPFPITVPGSGQAGGDDLVTAISGQTPITGTATCTANTPSGSHTVTVPLSTGTTGLVNGFASLTPSVFNLSGTTSGLLDGRYKSTAASTATSAVGFATGGTCPAASTTVGNIDFACGTGDTGAIPLFDLAIDGATGAIRNAYPGFSTSTPTVGSANGGISTSGASACQFTAVSGGSVGSVTITANPFDGAGGIASSITDANMMGDQLYDNTGIPGNPLNSFFGDGMGGYWEPGNALTPFGGFLGAQVSTAAVSTACSPGALQFNLACNAINVQMRRE